MKVKTIIACALTASALPLAALAQNAEPSGPQGTGWYGAPNAATPVAQPVQSTPSYSADQTYSSGATVQPTDQPRWRADMRSNERAYRRGAYHGFSADTNPPAPPQ